MPCPKRSRASFWLVLALMVMGLAGPWQVGDAAGNNRLTFRFQAGQLLGLRVGKESLSSYGLGGFYVRLYHAPTGPNLLHEQGLEGLPRPLPAAFDIDTKTRWQGKPTVTIRLPEDRPRDSGELELHVESIRPHHIYLIRFAHRGERLGGEYPPVLHLRQSDQDGHWAAPQQNVELRNGSYDWKEEIIPIPAVERAVRFVLMLHHPRGIGQFWVSEMVVQEVKVQPNLLIPGMWEGDAEAEFTGLIPGTQVTLQARAVPFGNAITTRATLSAPVAWLSKNPTAMVLSFRLPLAASGWRWGEDLRRERRIDPGESYCHYHLIGRRQFREVSRFPMALIAGPAHGIALMVPLRPTVLSRLRYDADGYLCAEFDLGMADRGRGPTETVTFSFDIVRLEPRWGWRAALAAYYARYPDLFASAAKEGGWWIGPSDQAPNLQDFGLQYAEQHFAKPGPTKANNEMGIYTCSYSEPWMWRILVSEENDPSLAKPLSFYLPTIEREASLPEHIKDTHDYWTAPRRDSVRAFLNSAIFGPDGGYRENAARTYAGTFLEINTSCLPHIRGDRWGNMNRGQLSYRYETEEDVRRCAQAGAKVEGVYFDSVGDWSDISAEDHRGEHFAFTSHPLTFSYATGAPVISGLAAMAEYMGFVRSKHFVTMANCDPEYAVYAAPFLDMIGAGENYREEAAADEILCHDRAIAYRKSVSFDDSGMLSVSPEEAEARLRLLLFYHIYPGIFYTSAESLEAVRPLYQRYIPLMRQMGRAGWEPIPWATADDSSLWVERYGPGSEGQAFFAIRNPTANSRSANLTIEATGFARPIISNIRVYDALSKGNFDYGRSVNKLLVPVQVPAHDTLVVCIVWPG